MTTRKLGQLGATLTLATLLLSNASLAQTNAAPRITPGFDWTLPDVVEALPYSGFITWRKTAARPHPSITVRGLMVSWRLLCPAPGEYDWQWLRDRIEENRAQGLRTGLHLKGVQRDYVPDWVIEELGAVVLNVPPLQPEGQPWRIQNVPPWQPKVQAAFLEFLTAFAETGIARDDSIAYAYIHGISASRGEEMFIRPVDLEMYEKTTGLTAELFADWLRGRVDAMCAAFEGAEHKLAFMSGGPVGPTAAFRASTANIWKYAFSRGTGIRGGGIDFQHSLFVGEAWSSRVEGGYCLIDDDHPTIKEGRFRGDENEEYGKGWTWRFGPVEGFEYRHRISTLRGLQMRQNFQLVSDATLAINPDLNEYVRVTQGYRRENSPDAWAYLRECRAKPAGTVKNIERWLIQREAPGSVSVATERVDRFKLSRDYPDHNFDFDARRADRANGQNGLLFGLDRVFWSEPGPATLKVTYVDRAKTDWRVRYTDADGAIRETSLVNNTGDGERKTATFHIDSLGANGAFPRDAAYKAWLDEIPATPTNVVRNGDFAKGRDGWSDARQYKIVDDSSRKNAKMVEFTFAPGDDTPHLDQLVNIKQGVSYRLHARIRNDGAKLRPGVRVASMEWATLLYLDGDEKSRDWQTLEGTFTATENAQARLQLFGQGRQYWAPGQSGKAFFADISLAPITRDAIADRLSMDFRIVADGPGDVTVTMVRVVKGLF